MSVNIDELVTECIYIFVLHGGYPLSFSLSRSLSLCQTHRVAALSQSDSGSTQAGAFLRMSLPP